MRHVAIMAGGIFCDAPAPVDAIVTPVVAEAMVTVDVFVPVIPVEA